MSKIDGISQKSLTLVEFERLGFLQELNRTFLHPLGLSMDLIESHKAPFDAAGNPSKITHYLEIQDHRSDPLGCWYTDGHLSAQRVENVRQEFMRHFQERLPLFNGSHIQPVPGYDPRDIPSLPEALTPEGAR